MNYFPFPLNEIVSNINIVMRWSANNCRKSMIVFAARNLTRLHCEVEIFNGEVDILTVTKCLWKIQEYTRYARSSIEQERLQEYRGAISVCPWGIPWFIEAQFWFLSVFWGTVSVLVTWDVMYCLLAPENLEPVGFIHVIVRP